MLTLDFSGIVTDGPEGALRRTFLEAALEAMAQQGDIAPFLALFHSRVIKALGIKDLRHFSEKSIKLMLMTYMASLLVHGVDRHLALDRSELHALGRPRHA